MELERKSRLDIRQICLEKKMSFCKLKDEWPGTLEMLWLGDCDIKWEMNHKTPRVLGGGDLITRIRAFKGEGWERREPPSVQGLMEKAHHPRCQWGLAILQSWELWSNHFALYKTKYPNKSNSSLVHNYIGCVLIIVWQYDKLILSFWWKCLSWGRLTWTQKSLSFKMSVFP